MGLGAEKFEEVNSMSQPNILLIMTDQWRGDCLGIDGHPDVLTPHLDDLASKGVLFSNAYTACPSCIAARAALHTGLKQENHRRVGYKDGVPWNYPVTMAGELSKAGYYTQCVGKMHVYPLRNSMGFHNIELHDGYLHNYHSHQTPYYEHQQFADDYFYWLDGQSNQSGLPGHPTLMDTGICCNSYIARPWPYAEHLHPTNWVTERSLDFLRRRDRDKPFFLMASYVRPHPPFDAPQVFFDMYKDLELAAPPIGDWADTKALAKKGRIVDSDTGPLDPELLRQMQVGYYACITHLDYQVGRLIESMREDDSFRNTVIIFTSDHGELLGDHHTFRKTRPYQGSVRIPLFVSNIPAGSPLAGQAGGKSAQLCELRDIMATALDIAGVEASAPIDGLSVMRPNDREYIHGEHSGGAIGNQYIVTERDKFCWFMESGREQYFNLARDPHECRDLINDPDCAERIGYLRGILIRELEGRPEGYSDGAALIAGMGQRAVI